MIPVSSAPVLVPGQPPAGLPISSAPTTQWAPVRAPPPVVTQPITTAAPPTAPAQAAPLTPQLQQMAEQVDQQKKTAADQITQSEQNLSAQYQSLITQQQVS